jgi:hypothetical protein
MLLGPAQHVWTVTGLTVALALAVGGLIALRSPAA